ncbi:kinase-like domain-containing protein [Lasiosphaeria miniovina]|uniref:Kinase-like domain-containing protein n=1 Tax=Lasiosphaeria miniovina TaxID=1954250 RepID=A0AA40DKB6_9PEZI|nr:kinase-like domain-containing protein [Lasiosphaeria miniovina]KAK0702993.1 kinase-like domain-containing protein [Lasiosphaeria miniovina]
MANPVRPPFKTRKKQTLDYFNFLRLGKAVHWAAAPRARYYTAFQLPFVGGGRSVRDWPGLLQADYDMPPREPFFGKWVPEPQDGVPAGGHSAGTTAKKIHRSLDAQGWEIIKILGWGGFGLVCLFKRKRRFRGRIIKRVVKWSFVEGDMRSEKEKLLEFEGAMHVAQISKTAEGMFEKAAKDLPEPPDDVTQNFMFLDYYPRGGLDKVLEKVAEARQPLSDYTLWLMFDCLFRMAVALRYPPKAWPGFGQHNHNHYERIPAPVAPRGRSRPEQTRNQNIDERNFVHFDIDPSNIMIADLDNGDHETVPNLKLNDVGLCVEITNAVAGKAKSMWDFRRRGKDGWLTPEQFSTEWNYVKSHPSGARIAGQYTWKTNLWQLGQVMWCLISHRVPPSGPIPENVVPDGGHGPMRWTYGKFITRNAPPDVFTDTDLELRNLVVRCMMDDPADRPEMDELERIISEGIQRHDPGPRRRQALRPSAVTVDPIFGDPKVPRAQIAKRISDWLERANDIHFI